MSATRARLPLAGYRDKVTELITAGESFGDIEDAIEEVAELTMDQKSALWLYAFSRRDRSEQRDSQRHLAALR